MLPEHVEDDLFLIKLAREIAIEHYPLETILERYHIDGETWAKLRNNARFNELLKSETEAWNSATNTAERTKLKAAALIEEWLPEANSRLHDQAENLNHKVELAKLLSRIGGLEKATMEANGGGERFTVTINMGADAQLKIEKELPPKVIDVTPEQHT